MVQEKQMKVYGVSKNYHNDSQEIRLRGEWLKKYGFSACDSIKVKCKANKITIEKVGEYDGH